MPIPVGDDGKDVPLALRRQYHVEAKEATNWVDAEVILKTSLGGKGPDRRLETLVIGMDNEGGSLASGEVHYEVHCRPHQPSFT